MTQKGNLRGFFRAGPMNTGRIHSWKQLANE